MRTRQSLLTLALNAAVHLCATVALAAPPIFKPMTFDEAVSGNKADEKLLIVDFTAAWCGPCRQMDKTTWIHADVVRWIGDNAVAIKVDVDKDEKAAKACRIQAMPTVIVFKRGEEFDRVRGFQSPAQLLAWLSEIQAGKRAIDKIKELAGGRADENGRVDIDARYKLAEALVEQGKPDEAATEYVWLWKNMLAHEPAMSGVRVSYMASDMQELAAAHAGPKQAFLALRDETEAGLKPDDIQSDSRSDWLVLNEIVADDDRTLSWFDTIKNQPQLAARMDGYLSYRLRPILISRQRWADAGRLMRDPVADVMQQHDVLERIPGGMPDEQRKVLQEWGTRHFREEAGTTYACLLAAGRTQDAADVASKTREVDDSGDMLLALVVAALNAGFSSPEHIAWLDLAAQRGTKVEGVRQRLTEALPPAR